MNAFLSGLVGEWQLVGEMYLGSGSAEPVVVPLRQHVAVRGVLGGRMVEIVCRQTDAPPPGHEPYEALYLIGFDADSEQYVFHLFDTFGVTAEYRYALGKLAGDRICFEFAYASGPFTNTLIRDGESDTWVWELCAHEDGVKKPFAEKRMKRLPNSGGAERRE